MNATIRVNDRKYTIAAYEPQPLVSPLFSCISSYVGLYIQSSNTLSYKAVLNMSSFQASPVDDLISIMNAFQNSWKFVWLFSAPCSFTFAKS